MKLRIAIIGIRGLPSTYSGYETFISELAPRLVARGHEVSVYCRRSLFKDRPDEHRGMRMIYLPSIEHKFFSTLSHSFFSMIHACVRNYDIVFMVNAVNGMWGLIPRLAGKKSVLNVDGMEWLRPKWNSLARWVFRSSAWLGTRLYNITVTDAEEMHRLYAQQFGIDTTYIAYGANIEQSTHPEVLAKYGLTPGSYYLIASRLVPDNNADLIIEGFVKSGSRKMLVIAGGANYAGNLVEQAFSEKLRKIANDQVRFLGHVDSSEHVKELHCNCHAYIHGHEFGGINPSLLKALGYSNAILALNTPFNSEVLDNGKYGILFDKTAEDVAKKIRHIEEDPAIVTRLRSTAVERIRMRFTWDHITDQYEDLFKSLA